MNLQKSSRKSIFCDSVQQAHGHRSPRGRHGDNSSCSLNTKGNTQIQEAGSCQGWYWLRLSVCQSVSLYVYVCVCVRVYVCDRACIWRGLFFRLKAARLLWSRMGIRGKAQVDQERLGSNVAGSHREDSPHYDSSWAFPPRTFYPKSHPLVYEALPAC